MINSVDNKMYYFFMLAHAYKVCITSADTLVFYYTHTHACGHSSMNLLTVEQ